jgi:hypothetical protein
MCRRMPELKDVESSDKDAKEAVMARPVRGQKQRFRTQLEERRAPRSCRAHEQTIDDVQPEEGTSGRVT